MKQKHNRARDSSEWHAITHNLYLTWAFSAVRSVGRQIQSIGRQVNLSIEISINVEPVICRALNAHVWSISHEKLNEPNHFCFNTSSFFKIAKKYFVCNAYENWQRTRTSACSRTRHWWRRMIIVTKQRATNDYSNNNKNAQIIALFALILCMKWLLDPHFFTHLRNNSVDVWRRIKMQFVNLCTTKHKWNWNWNCVAMKLKWSQCKTPV